MDSQLIPLFSEFGACVFVAQNFELDTAMLLAAIAAQKNQKPPRMALEEIFSTANKSTLGKLINDLRNELNISSEEEATLKSAVAKRNHLIHSFLTHDVKKLMDIEGRTKLINEITMIRIHLESAQEILKKLLDKYLIKYNLTTDNIITSTKKEFYERYS